MSLFNPDLDQRLADLSVAVARGETVTLERLEAFQHLPDRLSVSFGERRFVLGLDIARGAADQFEANGFAEAADQIRAAIS